jgi:hypothetical protein
MRCYLLGELAEEESVRVEDQYFSSDAYLELLQAVEAQLMDDYVRDRLTSEKKRRFEERYLGSPQGREGVRFALALKSVVAMVSEGVRGGRASDWRLSFHPSIAINTLTLVMLVLLAGLGGSWLLWRNYELTEGIRRLESKYTQLEGDFPALAQQLERMREESERLRGELDSERERRAALEKRIADRAVTPQGVVSFVFPSAIRGQATAPRVILVPSTSNRVDLQLLIDGGPGYIRYRAVLRRGSGEEVWGGVLDSPIDGSLRMSLPAGTFASGPYEIVVYGLTRPSSEEELAYYEFQVTTH